MTGTGTTPLKNFIELETRLTSREIEGSEEPVVDVQLRPTRESYELLQLIDGNTNIALTSADGDIFVGQVQDWDDGRYTITIELR